MNNWRIENNSLNDKELLKNEAIFNTANGYIGVRGNFEEGYKSNFKSIRGTYMNAFYEIANITYGEKAYGFPETMQKSVNLPDCQGINLVIEGERFSLFDGEILSYQRYLDMKSGLTKREIRWRASNGCEIEICITRIASFVRLELFAVKYEITPLNFVGKIEVESSINANVHNYFDENDPRVGEMALAFILDNVTTKDDQQILQVAAEAKESRNKIVVSTLHKCDGYVERIATKTDLAVSVVYKFNEVCEKIEFTKYNVFTDSRRYQNPETDGYDIANSLKDITMTEIIHEQEKYLSDFWKIADIKLSGDDRLQKGLRYNIYQLLQGVGRDSISNITAKGLSGEGYEGHYFWDTEIYVIPFFTLCTPKLARQLLKYRYNILDASRKRAGELGHKKGAAYSWRTITGDECSAFFPAGTAQYHINADIAYAYYKYYEATDDYEFIEEFGAEVMFETARIWVEIGHFHKGLFKIDCVTGPDEYTAIVNNNYYTNVMAKNNLRYAVKWYNLLKEKNSKLLKELSNKIDLKEEEIIIFEKAYTSMYLPYNNELKINEQDDTFLSKKIWDFENTPKEKYPLLLNFHPLTIYRYQVLKQADTVLAHFLLEEESDYDTIKNSYDYYEKISTHDSSLSCAIYGIMASYIGYIDKAYNYFIETATLDLDDTHNNTKDGVHIANMGGTWMSILYGFLGLRIKENYIALKPNVPKKWDKLEVSFKYRGATIAIKIDKGRCIVDITTNEEISIMLNGKMETVGVNTILEVK